MNIIGTFSKAGDEFEGEIITLSVQSTNVRIVSVEGSAANNAPTHRVYVGRAMIGMGWVGAGGDEVLALTLDDPSFTGPIRASLRKGEGPEDYMLIWQRVPTSAG